MILGNVSKRVWRESQYLHLFLTWTHLGQQGCPMQLRGDFQENFALIFGPLQGYFWQCVCNDDKANQKPSPRRGAKHSRLADTQARWRGWTKPSGQIPKCSYGCPGWFPEPPSYCCPQPVASNSRVRFTQPPGYQCLERFGVSLA